MPGRRAIDSTSPSPPLPMTSSGPSRCSAASWTISIIAASGPSRPDHHGGAVVVGRREIEAGLVDEFGEADGTLPRHGETLAKGEWDAVVLDEVSDAVGAQQEARAVIEATGNHGRDGRGERPVGRRGCDAGVGRSRSGEPAPASAVEPERGTVADRADDAAVALRSGVD